MGTSGSRQGRTDSGCFTGVGGKSGKESSARSVDRDLQEVEERAGKRVGMVGVKGRYHRLPRKITDDFNTAGKPLGSGYNGTVFSATSKHTKTPCAVKSFALSDFDPDKKKELLGEVEIFLAMDHPHVARLLEVYESETEVSLVMECMSGGELYDRVATVRVFRERDAAKAAYQMLLAIGYIHNEGVVHRDLKLENFLYDAEGSQFLKLIDFGFSKFFSKGDKMNESLGTVTYVAPEVLNKDYCAGSCDMWSFGVIVFVLLSGYMPFNGSSDGDIIRKIRRGTYEMRESRWSAVSEQGADFVKKLLVTAPKERLTSDQALAHPWIASRHSSKIDGNLAAEQCMAECFMQYAEASRFHQVCMRMMAWSLSLDDRRRLRDTFLELDKLGTGVILLEDVKAALKGKYQSEEQFDTIFQAIVALDVDNDGEIHYSDFLAAMMASRLGDHGEALRSAFRKFDGDNKGYVTQDGLQKVLQDEMGPREIEVLFNDVDVNGDGKISPNEFIGYLTRSGASSELAEIQPSSTKSKGCRARWKLGRKG